MKSKILKYTMLFIVLSTIVGGIYYLKLPNKYKAIVKTKLYHGLGIVDERWNIHSNDSSIHLITPTLVIDNIYKSLEGPKVKRSFQLDKTKHKLVWLTTFETKALSTNEVDQLSNDYIYRTDINLFEGEHYSKWQLNDRIGEQYRRLTSMSSGIESYTFPSGFGFPVFTNENLLLATQSLNHNIKGDPFTIKHEVNLGFKPHNKNMRPLMNKTVVAMRPYDAKDPFQGPTNTNPNRCLPIEISSHGYVNDEGESLSNHWVVFPGTETYRYDITHQLQLKDSMSMHHIATHIHPFAEKLALRDKTADSILFVSKA